MLLIFGIALTCAPQPGIARVSPSRAASRQFKNTISTKSRGDLTGKIHAAVDTNGLLARLGLAAAEAHDKLILRRGSPPS
jgi:hypothetical protein